MIEKDIEQLNSLYARRKIYYGDLHNHGKTGPTSDGKITLDQWRKELEELELSFVAILDHRQVKHMYLPEWDDRIFIAGSEPGTSISDSKAVRHEMHYNMIFENSKPLEDLLHKFTEFRFTGGEDGTFIYPDFTTERMRELIKTIKENGGFFVFPHPTKFMESVDPLDFWFDDETGFEIFHHDFRNEESAENYRTWCELLKLGKRVWACGGDDSHKHASAKALTAIYATEQKCSAFLEQCKTGDMVCGSAGIRMCAGDCKMGGKCSFEGKNLVISTGDFHKSAVKEGHTYKLVVLNENGIVTAESITPGKEQYFVYPAKDCRFYRAEIFDETENLRIAIGNPVWNEAYLKK